MGHTPRNVGLGAPGPFSADQLKSKDPYELSNGHALFTPPTGQRGGKGNLEGGKVLATDPDVTSAGIDVGFSASPKELRAPDISIGNVGDGPGWSTTAPPLAVEYADVGQDEGELKAKIGELFAAGTRFVWVVRLATSERHIEVHEPGKIRQIKRTGEILTAPGILRNPVPVEAMWDGEVANAMTLRNLLNRAGYESVEAVRQEGLEQGLERGLEQGLERGLEQGLERGLEQGLERGLEQALAVSRATLLRIAEARALVLDDASRTKVAAERSLSVLAGWTARAATVTSGDAIFDE
jgi:hypothetical protein